MASVEIVIADITTLRVDAIVNAANVHLLAGGGVCGAIFRAAGTTELQTACDAIGGCPTGDAVVTPSFALESRGIAMIVHAVGPVWDDGDHALADDELASAYSRALAVAATAGARSIAFPAISTGIYGFPAERAARIAASVVCRHEGPIDRIVLVAFDDTSADVLRTALESITPP